MMLEAEIDRTNLLLFPYGLLTINENNVTVLKTSQDKTQPVPAEVIEWLDALSFAPSFESLAGYVQSMKISEKLFNLVINRLIIQKAVIPVFADGSFEDIMICIGDIVPQFNKAFITIESDKVFENQPTVSFLNDNVQYNILEFTKNLLTDFDDSMNFGDRFTGMLITMKDEERDSFIFAKEGEKQSRLIHRVICDLQLLIRNKIIYLTRTRK